MLGILLLYFIYKYYSELAEQYNKNKWGYFILGVAVYYAGMFVFGALIGVVVGLYGDESWLDGSHDLLLSLMAFPFGILSTVGIYKYLQKSFARSTNITNDGSLDNEFLDKN